MLDLNVSICQKDLQLLRSLADNRSKNKAWIGPVEEGKMVVLYFPLHLLPGSAKYEAHVTL